MAQDRLTGGWKNEQLIKTERLSNSPQTTKCESLSMGSDGFYKLTRGQNSSEQSCEIYSLLQWSQKNQQKASEVSLNIAYA